MSATLSRHHDVLRALHSPELFSNVVSQHLNVPNGMDGEEHRVYRDLIEPFFDTSQVAAFQPRLQQLIEGLITPLTPNQPIEVMSVIAHPFAVQAQCAFMGWPAQMAQQLTQWMQAQNEASLAMDRVRLKQLADEFSELVTAQLDQATTAPDAAPSITQQLTQLRLHGEPLPNAYLVSIIRNWTVGELGTIAAAVGSIIGFLAQHPAIQDSLREQPELLDAAIQEILRIDAPLLHNRRRTTCPVRLADQEWPAEQILQIDWQAANTDPAVFDHAQHFSLTRDPELNLLYGSGPHHCPGKALAQQELCQITHALLQQFKRIEMAPTDAVRAQPPRGGYQQLWIRFNH